MKSKKILKKILLSLLFLIAAFVTYSLIPRVGHSQNSYDKPLKKANPLSISFQEELRKFAQDTATKTEVVIALMNNEIIFEKGNTKKLINLHSARKSIMRYPCGFKNQRYLRKKNR